MASLSSSRAHVTVAMGILVSGAFALNENPCTQNWNAGQTYDTFECTESEALDWAISLIPRLIAPLLIGVMVFLACPFTFAGRFCCQCCGGSKVRPGEGCCGGDHWDEKPEDEKLAAYTHGEVNANKYAAIGVMLFPVAYVVMCFTGASRLIASVDDITGGMANLIDWVLADAERIANALAPDGNYASSMSGFQTEYAKVRSEATDITKDWIRGQLRDEFVGLVAGLGYPSLIPAVFMVIGMIMALVKIRTCVPMLTVAFLFVFALPFGAASTAFFVIHAPINVVCNELDAQIARKPGVFQNYLYPQCDSINPILALNDTLLSAERDASSTACTELYKTCDNTTVYQSGSEVLWSCARPASCRSVSDVTLVMNSMRLKPAASNPCSTSPTCTLQQCATECSNPLRDAIVTTRDAVDTAERVLAAFRASELVQRWSDCNNFFDHIITEIGFCKNLPSGVYLLAAGFMVVVIGNVAGIVVFTLGSKRFFDRTRYDGGNAAFGELAPSNMNAGVVMSAPPAPPLKEAATTDYRRHEEEMSML